MSAPHACDAGHAPLVLAGIAPLDLPIAWPLDNLRVEITIRSGASTPKDEASDDWRPRAPSSLERRLLATLLPDAPHAQTILMERLHTGATFPPHLPASSPGGHPMNASAFLPEADLHLEGARAAALLRALNMPPKEALALLLREGANVLGPHEAHRLGATLTEQVTLCWRAHPPALLHPSGLGLFAGVLVHQTPSPLQRRRHLPEDIPLRKARDQAARAAAALLALERGDERPLREALEDVVMGEALGPHVPGFFPARRAALDAGALAFGLAPKRDTLVFLAGNEAKAHAAGVAAQEVLRAHASPAALFLSSTGQGVRP